MLGDGAGIMVLEEYEHAKARGAKIYAEVVGFGMSGDGYHMTSPSEDGSGGALAMEAAMRDAGVTGEHIGYVIAHGTSTLRAMWLKRKALNVRWVKQGPSKFWFLPPSP